MSPLEPPSRPVPVRWTDDGEGVVILDQTALPERRVERELRSVAVGGPRDDARAESTIQSLVQLKLPWAVTDDSEKGSEPTITEEAPEQTADQHWCDQQPTFYRKNHQ